METSVDEVIIADIRIFGLAAFIPECDCEFASVALDIVQRIEVSVEIVVSLNNSPEWISSLQTMGSVLLGGVLSYMTTSYFQRAEKRDDARDYTNALVWKILTITNDLLSTSKQLRRGFLESDTDDPHYRPWSRFPELSGVCEDIISIDAKDLQVILRHKRFDLAASVVDLNNNRTVINKSLLELFKRRSILSEKMNIGAVETEGRKVSYVFNKNQSLTFRKEHIEIETFTNSILERIPIFTELAISVSKDINSLLRENYANKGYMGVEISKVDGLLTHGDVIKLIAGKKIG